MALYIKNMAKPAVLATELVQNNMAGSNPAEIYAAASRHEEGGDDDTAVRLLAELLRIQPQHAEALQLLASILLKLGDPEEALRCAESALESGETIGNLKLIAACFAAMTQMEKEVQVLLRILAIDPTDRQTILRLGTICGDLGHFRSAATFFTLRVNEENWDLEAWQAIDRLLGQVMSVDKKPARDFAAEAAALVAAGDLPGAIRTLEEQIGSEPDNALAYNDLGVLYQMAGKGVDSIASYELAVSLASENVTFRKNLADSCLVAGAADKALHHYLAILQQAPDDLDGLRGAAVVHAAMGEREITRELCRRILVQEPENAEAKQLLASVVGVPVSIVIPVFNRADLTEQCLDAIKTNTPAGSYEIIVVDNGSTDGTANLLERSGGAISGITNRENLGFAHACNQGAAAAAGEIVLFLNNDTEPEPGWLEPITAIFAASAGTGIVGNKLLYPDRTIQHAGVAIVRDDVLGLPINPWHIGYRQENVAEFNELRRVSAVTGACLAIRKSVFCEVGGFDEQYWNGYEDVDLCFKVVQAGHEIIYEPASVVIHHESKSGVERRVKENDNLMRLQELWGKVITPDFIRLADSTIIPNRFASIVIVTYNSEKTIDACLASVARHLRPHDDVVVVDNGSRDRTVALVETFIQGKERFCFVKSETNLGFAGGSNAGIREASNPYVVLLNPDTVVTQGWSDAMTAHFADPTVAAVGPLSNFVAGLQKLELHQREPLPPNVSVDSVAEALRRWNPSKGVETKLLIGFCLMVRRDLLLRLGLLDEELFLGNDDLELSWRLRAHGWRLAVATDAFVYHEGQQSFDTEPKQTTQRLVQESSDALYRKLSRCYAGRVPTSMELWGMNWFSPTAGSFDAAAHLGDLALKPYGTPYGSLQPTNQSSPALGKRGGAALTSIVILTWNELATTKECMASIQRHTPESHEIIFVDNGSSDGTVTWLRQLVTEHANYRLIENRKNLGFAKGCNQGIEAAGGESILLLNNDVVVTEGWLAGMIEALTSAGDIGIVGPMTNNISGPQQVPVVGYTAIEAMHEYAAEFRSTNRHRIIPMRRIVGFCMLFRRELVEKIGLLDEQFGSGNFEDDDYCLRAALAGFRNIIAGDVFIHHYGSRSFIGNRVDYGQAMAGNGKRFQEKWHNPAAAGVAELKLVALRAVENALDCQAKGELQGAVAILLEGIKHAPEETTIYYTLAELLIEAKQFKDALETVEQMPRAAYDARREELIGYCQEGLELYREAAAAADRALLRNPASAPALNLQGILAYKNGVKSSAEALFNRAIAAGPGYGEPYTNLGVVSIGAGNDELGMQFLEKGFILSPTAADIASLYHNAATELGAVARAELLFREAASLHPQHRGIQFFLIDLLLGQDKHAAAMELIEQAIVNYGVYDGLLGAALEVRGKIGHWQTAGNTGSGSTVSLCMIVKNEEQHLARCLASAKPLVDEMVVVDTGSTDRTRLIAEAFGAKVFDFPWTSDFAEARNVSLAKASADWVLILDADEVIACQDQPALLELIKQNGRKPSAYALVSRNYTNKVNIESWSANDGSYHSEEAGSGWTPSSKVRLFPNDRRIRFENPVHELVEPSLKKIGMPVKACSVPVHHYGKLDEVVGAAKGEAYYQLGKQKIEALGNDLDALCELAIQAGELKKFAEALELWQRVVAISDDIPVAFFNMSAAYLELGQYQEGLKASARAMALDPQMKEASYNYAVCAFYAGDAKRSIATLEDLLRRFPGNPSHEVMLALAFCCDGQPGKGLDLFRRLRQLDCGFSDSLVRVARKLIAAGRSEYARLLLTAAMETDNINPDLIALVNDLLAIPESRLNGLAQPRTVAAQALA